MPDQSKPNDLMHVLLLPGWLDSDSNHWQSRWQLRHGYQRVTQSDWVWPKRGDWMARLDEVVQSLEGDLVLVAHSLGCQLVASWASHTQHASRVKFAMLVAPPDLDRGDLAPNLSPWRPATRTRLPFAALAVVSNDDPYCDVDKAWRLANDWGASVVAIGDRGHINGESGLGDWDGGHAMLRRLMNESVINARGRVPRRIPQAKAPEVAKSQSTSKARTTPVR
jgi:uncharacterized protein